MFSFFQGVFLFFCVCVIAAQGAEHYANAQRADEAKARAVAYDAKQHADNVERCATGKTTYIIYAGKHCKGSN